jgi:hypothetical protein
MTIERAHSTNGRMKVEQAIADTREALQVKPKGLVRPRKLFVPVLLALGVLMLLRYFERSTGN